MQTSRQAAAVPGDGSRYPGSRFIRSIQGHQLGSSAGAWDICRAYVCRNDEFCIKLKTRKFALQMINFAGSLSTGSDTGQFSTEES